MPHSLWYGMHLLMSYVVGDLDFPAGWTALPLLNVCNFMPLEWIQMLRHH
jgi:hypothetical protein